LTQLSFDLPETAIYVIDKFGEAKTNYGKVKVSNLIQSIKICLILAFGYEYLAEDIDLTA